MVWRQGWAQIAGAVAAAAVCAGVARVLGYWLAGRSVSDQGSSLTLPLTVNADGVLLLSVFSSLLVIAVYAAFARDAVTPAAEQSALSSP